MSNQMQETREQNRKTVRRFFEVHGHERLALFAEDGYKLLPWTMLGHELRWNGRAELEHNFTTNVGLFTGWRWSNIEVFDTQYESRFWVECDGAGVIRVEGHAPVNYANHYIMSFELMDGKIKAFREFCNAAAKPTNDAGEVVPMPPLGNPLPQR